MSRAEGSLKCPLCRQYAVSQVRANQGGAMVQTFADRSGNLYRQVVPVTYWACSRCEWAHLEPPPASASRKVRGAGSLRSSA